MADDVVVAEETPTVETPAMEVANLSSLINRYLVDIEKIKQQLKTQREMFNGAIENDKAYQEQSQQVKELTQKRNAVKQTIVKQPAIAAVVEKQKELKREAKDLQDALSRYLERYQQVAKTNIIEGEDGEIREIVPVYKLVKKRV